MTRAVAIQGNRFWIYSELPQVDAGIVTMVDLIANRFSLGKIIGKGGMGTVYVGVDTLTQAPVAIKILKPDVVQADPTIVERFEREGEMLRRLNHPNIVKVIATASTQDQHVIVMDYIEGGSLQDRLKATPQLPVDEVLNIALDLTDALIRAHRLEIIHRDIKPANVLINADGTPLLTDFGVARMGNTTGMTQTGVIVGTLAYLAPEALSGEPIDERSDIWAFGVMLYEMLAGERPFRGESTGGVINSILNKPTPDMFQFRADVPWTLLGIIYWMLEKDRDKRPESFRFIGAMIENIMSGKELPLNWFGTGGSDADYVPGKVVMTEEVPQITDDDLDQIIAATPAVRGDQPPMAGGLPTRIFEPGAAEDPTPPQTDSWRADPIISRSDWQILEKRTLHHPPRIFISYRRADSIAVTGRIYDRLAMAFGAENVFKDMDKIPVGSDFRRVINSAVANCDVQLAIMGREWLMMANANGRRLDDPNDFVRIEIESGLQNEHVLVIPVLVGNAPMPDPDALPASLRPLVYRHAAPIRNDPDFNRDIEWLINQIHHHFEIAKPKQRRFRWRWMGSIAAVLVLLVAVGLFVSVPSFLPTGLQCDMPESQPNEYYVGVSVPTGSGSSSSDQVRDEIRRELQNSIENLGGAANIRIVACEGSVRSTDEARALSQGTGLHVLLWGTYNDTFITLTVQAADGSLYAHQPFPTDVFNQFTQATFIADRSNRESFAYPVLAIFNAIHTYTSQAFDLGRNIYLARLITRPQAQIDSIGVVGAFYEYVFAYWRDDLDTAMSAIERAIDIEASPILYSARGLGHQRLNNISAANADFQLAESLAIQRGVDGWVMPKIARLQNLLLLSETGDFEEAMHLLDEIIDITPNDWYARSYRSSIWYLQGDFERAKADVEIALANNPPINLPYGPATAIALRELDMIALHEYLQATSQFPDASITEAVVRATYPEDALNSPIVQLISAFAPFVIGDWETALENTQRALDVGVTDQSDIYFIQGFAYCALGDLETDDEAQQILYAQAEEAFTQGVAIEEDYAFIYFLRAYVRQQQRKVVAALRDTQRVAQDDQSEIMQQMYADALAGEINCAQFTSIDFSQYASIGDDNE